jgi:hypothetical protein
MPEREPDAAHPSVRDAWEAHEMAQLRHFGSLTLRMKLEAVEGMADVVRRFAEMRRNGGFRPLAPNRVQPPRDADANER